MIALLLQKLRANTADALAYLVNGFAASPLALPLLAVEAWLGISVVQMAGLRAVGVMPKWAGVALRVPGKFTDMLRLSLKKKFGERVGEVAATTIAPWFYQLVFYVAGGIAVGVKPWQMFVIQLFFLLKSLAMSWFYGWTLNWLRAFFRVKVN